MAAPAPLDGLPASSSRPVSASTRTTASTTCRSWRTSPPWSARGASLGAFSVSRTTREGALRLDAAAHAQEHTPERPSIVNGSVAAAVRGEFGDVRFTGRTRGSELFVNPLMCLYFAFDLPGLAARCRYLDRIEDARLMRQVPSRIGEFGESVVTRPPRAFPHWAQCAGSQ